MAEKGEGVGVFGGVENGDHLTYGGESHLKMPW